MGLVTLRNPLSFPGGRPWFDPNHFVLQGQQAFSCVARSDGSFLPLTGQAPGTITSTLTGSIDAPLGPAVLPNSTGKCTFTNGMFVGVTGLTFAFIGRWTNTLGLAVAVGSTTALGNPGSANLYIYDGGTFATMSTSGIAAVGDPVFCVGSIAPSGSPRTVTFGILNLKTGVSATTTTTGSGGSLVFSSLVNVYVGNYVTGNAAYQKNISAAAVINNFLPAGTIAEWLKAPWDFWYPPTVRQTIFSSLVSQPIFVPPPPSQKHEKQKERRAKRKSKHWGPDGDLFENPEHEKRKRQRVATFGAGAANSASFAITEPADTFAFAATDANQAALAFTEPAETFAFNATDANNASFAVTELADTFSFAATDANNASFAVTEPSDTFSLAASDANNASFAVTEAADTFSFAASNANQAALAVTESADTFAFDALNDNEASFAIAETADAFSFNATNLNSASFAVTEQPDAFSFNASDAVSASFAITESADAFSFNASNDNEASFALTEPSDVFSFNASDVNVASLAFTEPPDVFAVVAFNANVASFSILEDADTFAFVAFNDNKAALAYTEPADVFSFSIRPTIIVPPRNITLRADRDSPFLRADRDSPNLRAGRKLN